MIHKSLRDHLVDPLSAIDHNIFLILKYGNKTRHFLFGVVIFKMMK